MLFLTLGVGVRCRYIWVMDAPSIIVGRTPASGVPVRVGLFGDERLARLVGSGSERAFAAIYDRYHQQLYRYCRSIVRDEADAQDALQSALTSALVALKRGQRDTPLRPWLFRIAHNESISLMRRRAGTVELTDALERCVISAEERAGERGRLALLVADLQALPDRQRGALVMRELSGLSHDEIAVALGTSVGTAKQAIFEARRALLEFAEGRSMVCEDVRRTISDGDGRALRARRVRAHLRECAGCAAFAAAIPARRADLQALVPVLAPAASAAVLAHVIGAGSGHGAGAGAGGVAAGAAGKTVGATVAAKALVGTAVLVTAAAGVTGVRTVLAPERHAAHSAAGAQNTGTTPGGVAGRAVQRATGTYGVPTGVGSARDARHGARTPGAGSSHWARSARRASMGSGRVQSGVGASGLPSQARGSAARSVADGAPIGSSPGVGQRATGPPASIPAAGHRSTAAGSHPSGASGSHAGAGTGLVPSGARPSTGKSSSHGAGSVPVTTAPSTGQSVSHGPGSVPVTTPTTPAPPAPVTTATTPAPPPTPAPSTPPAPHEHPSSGR
jgi:RNA polymerase sigma factor (sigma-70 family)